MLVFCVQEHIEIFDVLHLSLDLKDLRKWRDHLHSDYHSALFVKEALDNLSQTVTSAVFCRYAFDVDSPGF